MPAPLAYFLTWTTYGTWLPGDARGWVDGHKAAWHMPIHEPDPVTETAALHRMAEKPFLLKGPMRPRVEAVIRADCLRRGYELHAVSARSNHIHVVVSTGDVDPDKVMETFKVYCTRELKDATGGRRRHWWTEGGSTRYINDATSLAAAVCYVQGQDVSWRKIK